MINEQEIEAVLIKIGDEKRWCIEIFNPDDNYLYAYRDILSEKTYPPRNCERIRKSIVMVSVVEIT
jgi:hypothetical protein